MPHNSLYTYITVYMAPILYNTIITIAPSLMKCHKRPNILRCVQGWERYCMKVLYSHGPVTKPYVCLIRQEVADMLF